MKIIKLLFAVVVVALLFSNCEYNFIVPVEIPPVDPGDSTEVSFAEDILPIFNDGDYCTSCHSTGKTPPDLTPDYAYAAINTPKYINADTPEESMIYLYPHPDTSTHMRKKYNSAQAAIILRWIQEGANNN